MVSPPTVGQDGGWLKLMRMYCIVYNTAVFVQELSKPPLPRDTRELEEFLVSLDSLPVHDFRKGQRSV